MYLLDLESFPFAELTAFFSVPLSVFLSPDFASATEPFFCADGDVTGALVCAGLDEANSCFDGRMSTSLQLYGCSSRRRISACSASE